MALTPSVPGTGADVAPAASINQPFNESNFVGYSSVTKLNMMALTQLSNKLDTHIQHSLIFYD